MAQTSVSDFPQYLSACLDAATIPEAFAGFRANLAYRWVVEPAPVHQGLDTLEHLLRHAPDVLVHLEKFRENDRVGGPLLYEYPTVGWFAPATLRYVKCLADLKMLFGSLDGLSILEIGGGYGGQCRIIQTLFEPSRYTLLDLEEPLALTSRYLSHFDVKNVELRTLEKLEDAEFDLVISNYALSEIRADIQLELVQRFLRPSHRGYLTWNISPGERDRLLSDGWGPILGRMLVAQDILDFVPGSRIWDAPMVREDVERGHSIIVWGTEPEV